MLKLLTTEDKMMLPITDLQHTLGYIKEHERFKTMMEDVRKERNRQSNLYNQRKRQNVK